MQIQGVVYLGRFLELIQMLNLGAPGDLLRSREQLTTESIQRGKSDELLHSQKP